MESIYVVVVVVVEKEEKLKTESSLHHFKIICQSSLRPIGIFIDINRI